jgi:hypothetical protein
MIASNGILVCTAILGATGVPSDGHELNEGSLDGFSIA